MKNILLVGDSIRLGYDQAVKKTLEGRANVYAPTENCRFAAYVLRYLHEYRELVPGEVDLIHWNTGIWDLHRCTADGLLFTPLDEYVEVNRRLAIQMESYTKNLIWATIIPGGPALDKKMPVNSLINTDATAPKVYLTDYMDVWNADVRRYNEAATALMRSRGIRVNDLYSVVSENLEEYISDDGIHPSPAGYSALAKKVAAEIRLALG